MIRLLMTVLLMIASHIAYAGDVKESVEEAAPEVKQKEALFTYDSGEKRDPFVPLVGVTARSVRTLEDIATIRDIRLQGVAVAADGRNIAIINGHMIKEGVTAGRLTIVRVTKKAVVLKIDEVEYEVELKE